MDGCVCVRVCVYLCARWTVRVCVCVCDLIHDVPVYQSSESGDRFSNKVTVTQLLERKHCTSLTVYTHK